MKSQCCICGQLIAKEGVDIHMTGFGNLLVKISRTEMLTSKFPKSIYSSFGIPEDGHVNDFDGIFDGNRFGQFAGARNVPDNLDCSPGLFQKKNLFFFLEILPLLYKIWPPKYFLDGKLHIILNLRNLEIGEHSSFFYY